MTAEPKTIDAHRAPLQQKHFIIATAGHVDHGKSALIKALTGTDPDRLPEEKARGITIDLGFAELNLTAPNSDMIHAGIVDVPGHEDFVRNMIAGVGSIDLVLFVVAADDGWMPQSEEHLQILTYLGVKRAVIALTKCDLGRIDIVTAQIRDRLRETLFARSRIIPTSVRTGEGIEDLKNAFASELATMQPQRDYGKPRLFIDRVFSLHGIGTVVTGTLTGGGLQRGQCIVVQPQNLEARIRSLQSHGSELDRAQPGMRTAINLADVAVDQIKRGDVITDVDLGQASSNLLVQLVKPTPLNPTRPLKNGSSVYLHHGTSRVAARITLLEDGIARLKMASPILAFLGDHFVLRDPSEQQTIGGGVVIDPDGQRRNGLTLRDDVGVCVQSEIATRRFVEKDRLLRKSHFSSGEISAALKRLEHAREIVVRGGIAATTAAWEELRTEAISLIDNAHKRNPERTGLDFNELRAALPQQRPEVFDALIVDLSGNGFARTGSAIARASHRPTLAPALQATAKKIREALLQKPFDPPSRKELEQDRQAQQAIRFMIETGELIEIAADVILLRDNFEKMKNSVANFISKNGPATVSELRQELNSSRRVMVPFLERLDRDGITRRTGDKRSLR